MKLVTLVVFWLVVVAGSLSLDACTTWKPLVLPSGQHGYIVDCSGTNLSWSHCYRKAGTACPRGYDITQRMDAHGTKVVPGDLFGVLGGSVQDRNLMIVCRNDGVRTYDGQPVVSNHPPTGAITYPASGEP